MNLSTRARLFASTLVVSGILVATPAHAAKHKKHVVYVRVAPPAPIVEQPVVARHGYAWTPGYHRWDGRAYVWVPGHEVRVPRARAAWVPGHWAHERRGYYWVNGHWR